MEKEEKRRLIGSGQSSKEPVRQKESKDEGRHQSETDKKEDYTRHLAILMLCLHVNYVIKHDIITIAT